MSKIRVLTLHDLYFTKYSNLTFKELEETTYCYVKHYYHQKTYTKICRLHDPISDQCKQQHIFQKLYMDYRFQQDIRSFQEKKMKIYQKISDIQIKICNSLLSAPLPHPTYNKNKITRIKEGGIRYAKSLTLSNLPQNLTISTCDFNDTNMHF